jgi:hypothetical protein
LETILHGRIERLAKQLQKTDAEKKNCTPGKDRNFATLEFQLWEL